MQPQNIPQPQSIVQDSNKKRRTWAFVCLFGPTALIIISVLLYALMNFFLGSATTNESDLLANPPVWKTIMNVVLFLVGAITVLTWLPGIIIGIVLLATPKR